MKMELGEFDLHMHSQVSDGTLAPEALVARAASVGLKTIALTDHDAVEGISSASTAAEALDLDLISGIELTLSWRGRVLHLIGLNFDHEADALANYLGALYALRDNRASRIVKRLVKQGVDSSLKERVHKCAGNGQIGRPHIAQALVELGSVASFQEAFDRYLGQGKVGDVKVEWPDYEKGIELIKNLGGRVILAHPTKYNLTFTKIRECMSDLLEAGADGLEVSYPGVTPGHLNELTRLADQLDCYVSAGSDFHSPEQRWTALGRYPKFPTERLILRDL